MATEHLDDNGNVRVDFVWGNMAMQPNYGRSDNGYSFGGGFGDNGWEPAYSYSSDTLRTSPYINNNAVQNLFDIVPRIATDHVRASTGYSNFPEYIPNYAGDADSGLEAVVPNVVRLNKNVGRALLESTNLDYNNTYVNPQIGGVESTGTTIRFYVDNLYGLKAGDTIYADNTAISFPDFVTITLVGNDGLDYFEIVVDEAPEPALETETSGTVWPYGDLFDVILDQDIAAGTVVDEGSSVAIIMLGD